MEIFWLILASTLAGVGTGLAGLSAATVMVPILIVLCPSFAGENGAYQASAIALASDIIGSALAAYTYDKYKNIDLKRGGPMFVCIVIMCTVGSYMAWLAGNVVLGTLTLYLTVGIGIRFLLKPDTSKENPVDKGAKLDLKGLLISLFFGLTIGFGTGFVGSGGGMMMLVVFTAFLGMDLKTSVGTSTFIMTFTALIASVSHILINPAIVLEKWPILILCMSVATITSLYSAQFANRVSNRTVGLVTGAVLTILGFFLLGLHYWPVLSKIDLVIETVSCLLVFIKFIIPCVIVLLLIHFFTKVPRFVFRKILHLVAFSCVTIMLMSANTWKGATISSILIAVLIYPILSILENESWFAHLFVQKKEGEIKTSLLMLFFMFALISAISWGVFGQKDYIGASILMWGCGDGAAALVGIPWGKHKIPLGDHKKSWEGTLAMYITSLSIGILFSLFYAQIPLGKIILASLIGTIVELISASTWDTVTVPISILVTFLII
ncbi:MAG: TSUP family transporter [Firmicutes bacterium]|nr:TSUP family transporter [Bacillota bacterium]